ncbi:hypothetical protein TrCOL_g5717 [Triparma columacea]|uniref:Coenzyme Q-binding protein COQ10 START domain-containing protein n=1 Tax=Triparma columacea TaxID=722753 RepID=A0A9W7LD02_9STRA|nr:hypothetical protein TrCOL_g5717 [Triparma columacea]
MKKPKPICYFLPITSPPNPPLPNTLPILLATRSRYWGTPSSSDSSDDSCELVSVEIVRTSVNSRRISGTIIVDRGIRDVWAILTDYDRLSEHVPNLVESRRIPVSGSITPSTGRCRLYQKGAQKIAGFEFGASVTMDMEERFYDNSTSERLGVREMRKILFKCKDSKFFKNFDGEWKVEEIKEEGGEGVCTKVSYSVDVRPKGVVPVLALEWRIREDVPTNLRSVKKASEETGYAGVMRMRGELEGGGDLRRDDIVRGDNNDGGGSGEEGGLPGKSSTSLSYSSPNRRTREKMRESAKTRVKDFVGRFGPPRGYQDLDRKVRGEWEEEETLAAYNKNKGRK